MTSDYTGSYTDMSNGRQRPGSSSLGLTMSVWAWWTIWALIHLVYSTVKRRERWAQWADLRLMMVSNKYFAMAIFHRSRRATAAFLGRLSATNPRLLAVTPRTRPCQQSTSSQHKVTLSGETLYIEQDLAEALGWTPQHTTDGASLRLSGWRL